MQFDWETDFEWSLEQFTDCLEPLVLCLFAAATGIFIRIVTVIFTDHYYPAHSVHRSLLLLPHSADTDTDSYEQQAAANGAAAADNGVSNGNANGHATGANGNMVKTFQAYLPPANRTYSCVHCRAHLASHDELISKVGWH